MRTKFFDVQPNSHEVRTTHACSPAAASPCSLVRPYAPSGDADSWFDAVMPYSAPEVAALVYARGGGQGYMSGEAVKQILAYWWAHH